MTTKIYINGAITGPQEAKISVFDRGFLYGDSVYEVLRSSAGTWVDLEPHLDRLQRSAKRLALTIPPGEVLRTAILETTLSAGNAESYMRVVVTRGQGEVGLDTSLADKATMIVIVKPLVLPAEWMYEKGITVRLVNVQRTSAQAVDPSVKSGNYLNNILALAEAKRSGDYEAIMCDRKGKLAEGASSNIFWVQNECLFTPSLAVGLLAGITRQRVLEICAETNIEVREGHFGPDTLRQADEAFLTSSIRGVMPIAKVDGKPMAKAAPGVITKSIMQGYADFLLA